MVRPLSVKRIAIDSQAGKEMKQTIYIKYIIITSLNYFPYKASQDCLLEAFWYTLLKIISQSTRKVYLNSFHFHGGI